MSQEMENVYQTKVKEKLQKLEENKQNVKVFLTKNSLKFICRF